MSSRVPQLAKERPTLRECGIVEAADLYASGWTRRGIARAESLTKIAPGVFLEFTAVSPEGQWLQDLAIQVVRTRPSGVVAGPAAAALHGLDGYDQMSPLRIQIPHTCRPRRAEKSQIITRTREVEEPVSVGGFPVTPVIRTLVDLGECNEPRPRWPADHRPIATQDLVELAVEYALHNRLARLAELETTAAASTRPGAAVLRTVLARRPLGASPTESYLETRCVQVMRADGLPTPQRQVKINDRSGRFIGRVDLAIGRVVIECDGRENHDNPEAFVKDRDRWTRLQAEGYVPLVLTFDHVERQTEHTCALIERTLALARSA